MTNQANTEIPQPPKKGDMPFLDHIEELRWRLIKIILAVAIMAVISFIFADDIFKFLIMPLGKTKLHFTEVTGSFYAYLKVSFYCGLFAAFPFVLYQLWKFIAPGLYPKEKHAIVPMVFFSTVLFLTGVSFCFFVVLPFALTFLIGYGGDVMIPIITVSSYVSFAGLLLLAFGLTFQLPVVGYFLGRIGLISSRILGKGRPYAIVIILIVAGVLTPTPDVFTQLLLAVPLYLLYEATIILVKFTGKKR
jgi:sec-independent protein translocase protein TatC